jgi:hypothetical protein
MLGVTKGSDTVQLIRAPVVNHQLSPRRIGFRIGGIELCRHRDTAQSQCRTIIPASPSIDDSKRRGDFHPFCGDYHGITAGSIDALITHAPAR